MSGERELKFLVDVGVSKKAEEWLRKNGYDVKAVRESDPRMDDREVLKSAISENRMVVTMDKDFGELVFNSHLTHSGVLLLRIEDANSNEKVRILENILGEHKERLTGNFCVFQNGKLRIKTH